MLNIYIPVIAEFYLGKTN